MDYATEQKNADQFFSECTSILVSKAHDYANDSDCFLNFRLSAQICKEPVELAFLNHIATKVVRLGELCHGKEPKNESVSDTLHDLANYCCLMSMYLGDNQSQS